MIAGACPDVSVVPTASHVRAFGGSPQTGHWGRTAGRPAPVRTVKSPSVRPQQVFSGDPNRAGRDSAPDTSSTNFIARSSMTVPFLASVLSHFRRSIRHYGGRDRTWLLMTTGDRLADRFEEHRAHLRTVAYRMLGSASEAEDAVQEAWIRFGRTDVSAVDNLRGWLTTVVARVCLDMLRTRASRREDPLDVHVPDPIVRALGRGDDRRRSNTVVPGSGASMTTRRVTSS
jgi:hypothetical protein